MPCLAGCGTSWTRRGSGVSLRYRTSSRARGTLVFRGGHLEDGFRVAQCVGVQRHRLGNLSKERIARLKHLPGLTWDRHADAWDRNLALRNSRGGAIA